MADFTPTAISKSSNFVTGSGGNKTSEVFTDLLANRTETYALITSIADQFYSTTAPSNPNQGMVWRDSANGVTKRWSGTAWEVDLATALTVTVRNSVLQGNVHTDGNPKLFEAGTGLACKLNATTTPLIITWMDGNDDIGGEKNKIGTIASDAASFWSGLPQSSTVFLYVDLTGSTVSGGYSALAPSYQYQAPSHSAGLDWIDNNTGKVFNSNGSAWTQKYRVYVGTATTNTTAVTAVSVYPYGIGALNSIWQETDLPSAYIPSGATGVSFRVGRNATYQYLYVDCQDLAGVAQNPTGLTVNVALNGTSQFTTGSLTTSATTSDITDFNVTAGDLLKFTVSNTTGLTGGVMIGLRKVRR
jgi:hypothetical protein